MRTLNNTELQAIHGAGSSADTGLKVGFASGIVLGMHAGQQVITQSAPAMIASYGSTLGATAACLYGAAIFVGSALSFAAMGTFAGLVVDGYYWFQSLPDHTKKA